MISKPQLKRNDRFAVLLKGMVVFAGLLVAFSFAGCASSGPEKKDDDFIEEWLRRSETARGHSPDIRERESLEIDDESHYFEKIAADTEDKILPDDPVTLRLTDAPVSAVIRAMARAAGQNMLISETVTGTMSVDINDIPWDQAFMSIVNQRGLAWSWEGELIRIQTVEDIQKEIDLSRTREELIVRRLAEGQAAPLVNRIVKVNYANAGKLSENLSEFLSRDQEGETVGRIVVNEETNSLLIQSTRNDMQRFSRMIDHLDRPRSQILIEANIVEANQETARELGMRWSGRYVTSQGSRGEVGIVGEPSVPAESFGGEGGLSLGLISGHVTGDVLYANLQALQREGKLNILSSPSITTMDNQMAYTEHGEKVPYETTDREGRPEVEFEDAVLRLEVVPGIIDGEYMKMNIKVKKDEVDFTQTVNGNPLIRRKETETNLVVKDGETIVISGLSKQTVTGSDAGIPLFKNIPILGWLFKGAEKSQEMEEFLIFITPAILGKSGSSAEALSMESP